MEKEKLRKIETFKDIEYEKERLNYKIALSEERILNSFNALTEKLTLDSLTTQIKESAIGMMYRTFKFAFNFFSRNKHDSE